MEFLDLLKYCFLLFGLYAIIIGKIPISPKKNLTGKDSKLLGSIFILTALYSIVFPSHILVCSIVVILTAIFFMIKVKSFGNFFISLSIILAILVFFVFLLMNYILSIQKEKQITSISYKITNLNREITNLEKKTKFNDSTDSHVYNYSKVISFRNKLYKQKHLRKRYKKALIMIRNKTVFGVLFGNKIDNPDNDPLDK